MKQGTSNYSIVVITGEFFLITNDALHMNISTKSLYTTAHVCLFGYLSPHVCNGH